MIAAEIQTLHEWLASWGEASKLIRALAKESRDIDEALRRL